MKITDLLPLLILVIPGFLIQWLLESWHPSKDISEQTRLYRSLLYASILYGLLLPLLIAVGPIRSWAGLKSPVTVQELVARAFYPGLTLVLYCSSLVLAAILSFCMRRNWFYVVSGRLGLTSRGNSFSVLRHVLGDPRTAGYIRRMGSDEREYCGELASGPTEPEDDWLCLRNVAIREAGDREFGKPQAGWLLLINMSTGANFLFEPSEPIEARGIESERGRTA